MEARTAGELKAGMFVLPHPEGAAELERATGGKIGPIRVERVTVGMDGVELRGQGLGKYGIYNQNHWLSKQLLIQIPSGQQAAKLQAAYERLEARFFATRVRGALSVSLGTDPEIFVFDANELVPAFNFLPPKGRDAKGIYQTIYWDGFQAEFTPRENTCLAYVVDSTQAYLEKLLTQARTRYATAKLGIQTVVQVPEGLLRSVPEEFVALGCKPSGNVYDDSGEAVPNPRELAYRFAGGHIHVGNTQIRLGEPKVNIVKALDAILGVASVSLFDGLEHPIRRRFYGRAGEFRTPQHGIEYRVLSNAWLCHPGVMHLVFELARAAAKFGFAGMRKHWISDEEATRDAINNLDVKLARKILRANKETLKELLRACAFERETVEAGYNTLLNGVEFAISDPADIEKNWKLGKGKWVEHSEGANESWSRTVKTLSAGKKA